MVQIALTQRAETAFQNARNVENTLSIEAQAMIHAAEAVAIEIAALGAEVRSVKEALKIDRDGGLDKVSEIECGATGAATRRGG